MSLVPNATRRWREVAGWSLVGLGALLAVLGWVGVSGKDIAPLQLPYLASGSIGGLLLGAVGIGLVVGADVRREHERLGRVEGEVLELQALVRDLKESLDAAAPAAAPAPRSRRRSTA
jgi:hypothetical protein